MQRSAQSGKAKLVVVAALLVVGGVGAWLWWPSPPKPSTAPVVKALEPGVEREMTEAERSTYVAASISVTDLAIGPDKKPDRDEVVPGLFRVTGKVHNRGDRRVHKVNLVVHLKDAGDGVLGTFVENVVAKRPLGPGETADFRFLVPEKKAFSGAFDHQIR